MVAFFPPSLDMEGCDRLGEQHVWAAWRKLIFRTKPFLCGWTAWKASLRTKSSTSNECNRLVDNSTATPLIACYTWDDALELGFAHACILGRKMQTQGTHPKRDIPHRQESYLNPAQPLESSLPQFVKSLLPQTTCQNSESVYIASVPTMWNRGPLLAYWYFVTQTL